MLLSHCPIPTMLASACTRKRGCARALQHFRVFVFVSVRIDARVLTLAPPDSCGPVAGKLQHAKTHAGPHPAPPRIAAPAPIHCNFVTARGNDERLGSLKVREPLRQSFPSETSHAHKRSAAIAQIHHPTHLPKISGSRPLVLP